MPATTPLVVGALLEPVGGVDVRLVTYRRASDPSASSVGLVDLVDGDEVVVDLSDVLPQHKQPERFRSVEDVLRAGALPALQAAAGRPRATANASRYPLKSLQLLPPVQRPSKVIGVGMNYRSFLTQLGEPVPEHPTLFNKTSSSLNGHGHPVIIPPNTDQAVPEGELAVIIGSRASWVEPHEAMRHIAGFTCANDISARNLEFQTTQWTNGKMLPTFCPLGPALVTADAVEDAGDLVVSTLLNGTVIQQGNTSGMVFGIDVLISRISMLVDLEIGDVILTGTPSDLGETDPPVFLSEGDLIEVHIPGIGLLSNSVTTLPTRK